MNTTLKNLKDVKRDWYQFDAKDFVLGRMATRIATILTGKHKTDYTPNVDMGDFVVVINASDMKLSGRKTAQKKYFRFSGYPGGITETAMKDLLAKNPQWIVREAVRLMLPKNRLNKSRMKRLKVVADDKHNYKITQTIS